MLKIFVRSLFLRILLNRLYLPWGEFSCFHNQDNAHIQPLQCDPFSSSAMGRVFSGRRRSRLATTAHVIRSYFFFIVAPFLPAYVLPSFGTNSLKKVIRFLLSSLPSVFPANVPFSKLHYLS